MLFVVVLGALIFSAWVAADWLPRLIEAPLKIITTLLDPNRNTIGNIVTRLFGVGTAEIPLMIGLAIALAAGTWGFFAILEDVVTGDPIIGLDRRIYDALQTMRTPLLDRVMIVITGLGDQVVFVPIGLAALGTCAALGRWRSAAFVLAAVLGSALFVGGLKSVIQRPRPVAVYDGIAEYSFPSGHATMSVTLFGFLAMLLIQASPSKWRRLIAFTCLMIILLIALSRLYLGAHWFSDVAAGLAFGAAWVALLAIVYFRTEPAPVTFRVLAPVVLVVAVAASAWHGTRDGAIEARRYARPAILSPSVAPLTPTKTSEPIRQPFQRRRAASRSW